MTLSPDGMAGYYPQVYHPTHGALTLHEAREKHVFTSYGGFQAIDVAEEDGEVVVMCQRESTNQGTLKAVQPSLPLLLSPSSAENVAASCRQRWAKQFHTFKQLKIGRTKLKMEPTGRNILARLRNKLQSDTSMSSVIDTWVHVQNRYKHLFNEVDDPFTFKPKILSKHTGGCLKSQFWPASPSRDGIILCPSSKDLSTLHMYPYTYGANSTLRLLHECAASLEFPGRIDQIVSERFDSEVYVGARCQTGFQVVKLECDGENFTIKSSNPASYDFDDDPTGIAVSPYIPNEFAFCTANGNLYQCVDDRTVPIVSEFKPRFSCLEQWYHCHYGAHPRQLIVGDRTGVAIIDCRTSQPRDSDLFAIPHRILHQKERVMVSCPDPIDRSYHWVAANNSLLLLDQRMPNHTVLNWSLMARNPPLYMDVCRLTNKELPSRKILLGGQSPPEVFCFSANLLSDQKSHCNWTEDPWKVSGADDFCKFLVRAGKLVEKEILHQRLTVPLAGVALVPSPSVESFAALQVTVRGDVFCQDYVISEDAEKDKTFSSSPGSEALHLDDNAVKCCMKWMGKASAMLRGESTRTDVSTVDVSMPFEAMNRMPYAHVLCSLCMPNSRKHVAETGLGDCASCGNELSVGDRLSQATLGGVIPNLLCKVDPGLLQPLPEVDVEKSTDPTSQLLLSQWYDNGELRQHLERRDEEVKERIRKLVEAAKTSTEGLLSPTALSSSVPVPNIGQPSEPEGCSIFGTGTLESESEHEHFQSPASIAGEHRPPYQDGHEHSLTTVAVTSDTFKSPHGSPQTCDSGSLFSHCDSVSPSILDSVQSKKRRRTDSFSSQASTYSAASDYSMMGFLATPDRLQSSQKPQKRHKKNDDLFQPVPTKKLFQFTPSKKSV